MTVKRRPGTFEAGGRLVGRRAPVADEPRTHRSNPYFGLNFYREEDSEWFFGRDVDCNRLITNLLGSRLTLVHADSGVGKSSLLRAGVCHRLRAAAQAGRDLAATFYVPVVFSNWRDNPTDALSRAIIAAISESDDRYHAATLPAGRLSVTIEAASAAVNSSLLIILDQFEEYFQYAPHEQPAPERFADELAACINRPDLSVSFLISLREDAYAGIGDLLKARVPNVYGNYLHIDYLDHAGAEDAIRRPLEVYNRQSEVRPKVRIDDALVKEVITEVHPRAYGLDSGDGAHAVRPVDASRVDPTLLQLVMETVWTSERNTGSNVLRAATFRALQGTDSAVDKIVDDYLDRALVSLDRVERSVAIDSLDHLVTPDGRKIAASVAHLAARDRHDEGTVASVLGKLAELRILRDVSPTSANGAVGARRFEILHDVLAPAISRVVTKEDERRSQAQVLEQIRAGFIASQERKRARFYAKLVLLAAVLAAATAASAVYAIVKRGQAERTTRVAQSLEVASYSTQTLSENPVLSALLAQTAVRIEPTQQARAALQTAVAALGPVYRGNAGAIQAANFSPDGRLVVTASVNGVAEVWDRATAHSLIALHLLGGVQLNSAEFSPDGALIATAAANGIVRLWDAYGFGLTRTISASSGGLTDAVFSPTGRLLATASSNGVVRIFSVATGQRIGQFRASTSRVNSVAFSPDGNLLLTSGTGGTAQIWSAQTHQVVLTLLTGDSAPLAGASFDPSGTRVVAASGDGVAWIWSATSGAVLRQLRGPTGAVYSAQFDRSGSLVLTANADGTVRIWNASNGQESEAMSGSFSGATFAPDGSTFVAAGFDGTARLPGAPVRDLLGPPRTLEAIASQLLRGKRLTKQQRDRYLVGIPA